jgi:Leucine-rich repeat (LRR) protein
MKPKMLRWPFGVSDDQMGKPPWMELRTVYVSKNKLKGLPYDFFKLTNLTDLRLDHNLMTNLAVTVSQLTNLRTLWLHNNELETLPIEVSVLQELRYAMLCLPFRENSFCCNRLLWCGMEY